MEKDQLSRKLAVILHADVVGSTSLIQKNERLAHERIQKILSPLRRAYFQVSWRAHQLHGDALLAEFERASDAIHWFFSRRLAQH